ncbi:RHS repeat domain-containing protein [Streptomyces sp. NPDC057611]|uniref:RHS repeat domain-containing protein n=1 Tax=Streptomyces sp. NPDC057611 TaxID=3346182 RepID=UPI0036CD84CA
MQKTPPVPVSPVKSREPGNRDDAARDAGAARPGSALPKPGTASVDLPGERGRLTRAGSLPVRVGAPSDARKNPPRSAQVQVLDQQAARQLGVTGLVFAVRADDAPERTSARVSLDYSTLAKHYGADWASRLMLRQLPSCSLESADAKDCGAGTALTTDNDAEQQTLTADVTLGAASDASGAPVAPASGDRHSVTGLAAGPGVTLLAATATSSGANGDYKATPLSPSGHWTAGDSSGSFGWGYPLETPDTPGGLDPDLGLGYSSQSLDGRTSATNNQTNWVGDGWSLTENSIERRFTSCNDDMKDGNNKNKNGDLCWGTDNAVMSLNGESHELVKDDKSGVWKLKDDDGTRIERLKDTARANGDNDGEYWRITDTEGTQYYFGYNRLPGWSSGKAETHSTWTAPVYGNQAGEPCHATDFANSWCDQAWRWNLDYVVDLNGNASAYYYEAETNRYGRNVSTTTGLGTPTEYVRGGYPLRIEYGLRSDNVYAANSAMAKVEFTVAERCLPDSGFDCDPAKRTTANAKRWPDVPVDQECKAGDTCKDRIAPTFWTTKRLTQVTTKVLVGSAYKSVDSWTLRHQFPDAGDGSTPALWLAGLTRTGYASDGAGKALPEITFKGIQLPNRVDSTGDGIPPLVRYRVQEIDTETGSSIGITYSAQDCKPGDLPSETTNTRRCYPVYWSSSDSPAADYKPVKDWFHKYVVTRVLENDLVGGSPTQQTDYTYVGGAAWAKSEDEFTQADQRTYSDYRGYGEVRTQVGNGTDGTRLDSRTRYFRGISGAKVADFEGNEVADHPSFAGEERAEITYDGSEVLSEDTSTPWRKGPTATRVRPGLPDLTSDMTGTQAETTRTPAKGGGWQRTRTERTFDEYGMVATETEDGDTARSGDESCTVTTYARNTAANILELEASEKATAGTCAAPGELISETRTYYDGSTTLGAAPTQGNATLQRENNGAGTGFIDAATTVHDSYGRPVKVTDTEQNSVVTTYTPTTGMPTKTVVTAPLGQTLTTETDPVRGVPVAETDANGKRTELGYDALGRLTGVWEPGRARSAYPDSPNAAYEYQISRTAPPVVTTRELRGDGSTETSYEIYDGLLRERQTQSPSDTGTGRVLTETQYDSRGLNWKVFDDYYATGAPEPKLVAGDDTKAPAVARMVYDGAGRPTLSVAMKYGTETRRTTAVYDGNQTTVIPPKGGASNTTVTDALGRTVEVIEYTNEARTASQSITYGYNKRGMLERINDPAGNVRTYTYDARGRETHSEDPDLGTVDTTYDSMDRPLTATDSRGVVLTNVYDQLGRRTALKQGSTVLSEWKYDSVAKGEMDETRRYVDGEAYVQRITGFTDDYQPTGIEVTIPSSQGALAGTYAFGYGYNERSGLLNQVNQPAIGDLPAERVATRYGADDQAQGLTASGRILVNSATYDPFGRLLRSEYNDQARRLYRTWSYDEHTGELLRTTTDRTMAPSRVEDTQYAFDLAGNINKITTVTGQDDTKLTDTQCFVSDALQRITEAWTAKDDCAAPASAATVGGPEPYWLSYRYDGMGNRTEEVRHDTSGNSAGDVKRAYHYAKQDGTKPTALTSVSTTKNGTDTVTDTFAYDATGNMTTREIGSRNQKLSWDAENQLAKVEEENGTTTEYTYDADGERLLRKDSTGTTLYLPGGNELLLTPAGKKEGTRYYDFDGDTVAVRTNGAIQFLFDDHHGTATTAIDATTQEVQRRSLAPFGESRGAVSAAAYWPGSQGFVGGTVDNTGLTQLGARAYDPSLGRFISVDPMTDVGTSQRMNAYAYANNNPVTFSDPDGLFFGKILGKVKSVAKKVAAPVIKTVKKVVKKTAAVVKKVVKTVKKVVKKTVQKVKQTVKKVARAAKKVVKRTVQTVKRYAKKTYHYTKKVYRSAKAVAKSVGKRVAAKATSAAKTVARGAKTVYKAATSKTAAKLLGDVSTFTGTIAGIAAMVPGGQGVAGAMGAISLATGVASAGVYALNGDKSAAASALATTAAAVVLGGAGSAVKLIRGSGAVAKGARAALGDGLSGVGGKLIATGGRAEKAIGRGSIALHTTAANIGGWPGMVEDGRALMSGEPVAP